MTANFWDDFQARKKKLDEKSAESAAKLGMFGKRVAADIEKQNAIVDELFSGLFAGMAGYCAGKLGSEYGIKHADLKRRVKLMESNRMKRTADARAMSKKNLVFAFVELGRQFDESANTIADLRVRLDASQSVAKIHGEEMTKRRDVLPKLDRAYEEIRRMRTLLAHYLESEVGS